MVSTENEPLRSSDAPSAGAFRRGAGRQSIHLLVLGVVVAGVFGSATRFGFVWDDHVLLVAVDAYRDFDVGRLVGSLANRVEYLPIRDLSYALDYALWGENPFGFHLTNLVLYWLNCVCVYLMARRLTPLLLASGRAMAPRKIDEIALLTALLFGVHPIHSEAVSFVSCRNVLLSGLFFFASCLSFARFLATAGTRNRLFYAASLLCGALAIFSKATAVILPGVLLLILALHSRRWRDAALLLTPFAALSIAAVLLFRAVATDTGLIDPDQIIAFGSRSLATRVAVAVQIPFFYLGKLAWPAGLSALYDTRFASDLGDPRVLLAAFALIAAAVLAVRLRTRVPEFLFGLGWYLVTLLPVLNFFATGTVVADRYAYLASFAFVHLIAMSAALAHARVPAIAVRFVAASVVVALSIVAFSRNGVWKSDETLWTDTIRVSPEGRVPYYNLGVDYYSRGEYEKAFQLFERYAERTGSEATLRLFQAQYAFDQGDPARAIALLEATPRGDEAPFQIPYLLAQAYEATGDVEKAVEYYAEVFQKGGGHAGEKALAVARERLAKLQAEISKQFESQRRALSENPGDLNARARLAVALETAGLYEEAIAHYAELAKGGGGSWVLYYNMGNAYRKLGRYEEAVASYERSASLNPRHPATYNNLGVSFKHLHEYDRAIRAFETAMRLDPDFANAPFNLAALYFRLGDREEATRLFDDVVRSFPELKSQAAPYLRALE